MPPPGTLNLAIIDASVDAAKADPITSATEPNDGVNSYAVAFLPEGDYRIDFTCDADIDDNAKDADTDFTDGPVNFAGEAVVTITAGKTTVHDFLVPSP